MTTELKNLQAICDDATKAAVALETLSDGKLSVSVHWPETQGDDGDYCHGQNTIVSEAHKVLAALESEGWQHCEFGGRKDFAHGGGTTHFAVERATVSLLDFLNDKCDDGPVVFFAGVGCAGGDYAIFNDPDFTPPFEADDLEGEIRSGEWFWNGVGDVRDFRGNTVYKIHAYVDADKYAELAAN